MLLFCMLCVVQFVKKGDVLMEFNGVPIANDGTVHLRQRERIYFSSLITLLPTGQTARVKVRGRLHAVFLLQGKPSVHTYWTMHFVS